MKKEEVTITFYAAECGEFHDFGEYTKCRTLEEAYKKYQKYCRTSANMCPAIEFSIHDPDSIYSDMEYRLPLSSKDRGDLELVPYYNEHPLVNEAIRQLEKLQKHDARVIIFEQRISVLGLENLPLRAGIEICRQPSDDPVVYL